MNKRGLFDYFIFAIEILGSFAILISGLIHLRIIDLDVLGLWEWVFQVALVIIVIEMGLKFFFKQLNDLLDIKKKEEKQC